MLALGGSGEAVLVFGANRVPKDPGGVLHRSRRGRRFGGRPGLGRADERG